MSQAYSCDAVHPAKLVFVTVTFVVVLLFVIQTSLVTIPGKFVSKSLMQYIYFEGYVNDSKGELLWIYSVNENHNDKNPYAL